MTCRQILKWLFSLWLMYFIVIRCSYSPLAQINDENSLYTVALGAYKDGFYDLAIDQFSQLLRLYPNSKKAPYAEFRIAEAFFKQKKYEQALPHYGKLLNHYASVVDLIDKSLYRNGQIHFLRQEYDRAAVLYKQLVSQYPKSNLAESALFWSAESSCQAGEYAEASRLYRQFMDRYPAHSHAAEALYGLGWSYMKLKDYQLSQKFFKEFVEKFAKSKLAPKARLNIADLEYRIGKYQEAAHLYRQFVLQYPDVSEVKTAWYGQGLSFYQAGKFPEAIEAYKGFLEKYPQDELAESSAFQLGYLYFKLENYALAVTRFEEFIERYKKSSYLPESYYYLGLGHQKLGRGPAAEKYLSEMVRQFAGHPISGHALLQLGGLYYQSQRYAQALEVYTQASASSDPKIAGESLYWLGEAYTSQKEYDKALQTFLKILQRYPGADGWVTMARFRAAGIYEYQQNVTEALSLYHEVQSSKGNSRLKESARKRIETLQTQLKQSQTGKRDEKP